MKASLTIGLLVLLLQGCAAGPRPSDYPPGEGMFDADSLTGEPFTVTPQGRD
jgi:hypothetical protein